MDEYFLISISFAVVIAVFAIIFAMVGGLAFIYIALKAVKVTKEFDDLKTGLENLKGDVTVAFTEFESSVNNINKTMKRFEDFNKT